METPDNPEPQFNIEKAIVSGVTSLVILAAVFAPLFGFELTDEQQAAIIGVAASASPFLVWYIRNSIKEPKK